LGPSIDGVPNATAFRDDITFHHTHYSPVTANIIDRSGEGPSPSALVADLTLHRDDNSLIYVRSPNSAAQLAYELMKCELFPQSSFLEDLGEWAGESVHPEWVLAHSLKNNIGIHHGRIPRALAHLLITLFNEGGLNCIICTSSMIEGV